MLTVIVLALTETGQSTAAVPSDLLATLQNNSNPRVKLCLGEERLPLEKVIRTTWIDLNRSQQRGLLVEGLPPCLATGDYGAKLLYVRVKNGWCKILDGNGTKLEARSTSTHGWRDLTLWQQESFDRTELIYQFDGNVYTSTSCKGVEFADPATGKRHTQPKSFPCNFNVPACANVQRSGQTIVSDMAKFYVPVSVQVIKGADADYGTYSVRYGSNRAAEWLEFVLGPLVGGYYPHDLGNPSIKWTSQKWGCYGDEYGNDWRGIGIDGRRWRHIGMFDGFAAYEGVTPKAADYFDKILDSKCCGECDHCLK